MGAGERRRDAGGPPEEDAAYAARAAEGFPRGWEWRRAEGDPYESLHDERGVLVAYVDREARPPEYVVSGTGEARRPLSGSADPRAVDAAIARDLGVRDRAASPAPRPRLAEVIARARMASDGQARPQRRVAERQPPKGLTTTRERERKGGLA